MSKQFDLNPELLNSKDIPLLIRDEMWLRFYEGCSNLKVKHKYARLVKLVSEKQRMEEQVIQARREKKASMNSVIILSEKACSEGDDLALLKMEEAQNNIKSLNERLEEMENRRRSLDERIRAANFQLLEDTVQVAYGEIKKQERMLEEIAAEMEGLKARLNQAIDNKHDTEERKNHLYRLVHSLLGGDETDKLDRNYFKE